MAVRWAVDTKEYTRGSMYFFDPDEIIVEPGENGRHAEPDIEWMIADIKVRGQETPVTVRSDGGKPVLVFGYQRLRALKEINERFPDEPKRKIACIFKQLTKEEAFRANISENRMRNETTPVDDAHNIKRLMNVYGYNDDQVLAAFFPDLLLEGYWEGSATQLTKAKEDARRWVRERMALIGLTPKAEQAVRDGRVKLSAAIRLNKLPAQQQDEVIATGGRVKAKDVRKAANTPPPQKRKLDQASIDRIRAANQQLVVEGGDDEEMSDNSPQARRWAQPFDPKEVERIQAQAKARKSKDYSKLFDLADNLLGSLSDQISESSVMLALPEALTALVDAIADAAAEASASFEFNQDVLGYMESWKRARSI